VFPQGDCARRLVARGIFELRIATQALRWRSTRIHFLEFWPFTGRI
jgi:hypothetical protein